MKFSHIFAAAALVASAAATAALAQQGINSSQMANSLAGVSRSGKLSLTGAQMRQAVLDNIRN